MSSSNKYSPEARDRAVRMVPLRRECRSEPVDRGPAYRPTRAARNRRPAGRIGDGPLATSDRRDFRNED